MTQERKGKERKGDFLIPSPKLSYNASAQIKEMLLTLSNRNGLHTKCILLRTFLLHENIVGLVCRSLGPTELYS